ncbi:MAG: hypothetical protein NW701_15475 [Nitrospira sp.]
MYWRQILIFVLFLPACASTPIQESTKGNVYLEPIPARQFAASHPVKLDAALIVRSLQGVMVREEDGQQAAAEQIAPAFSSDDIAFLAPAIASKLSEAAFDQQIGFRIHQTGGVGSGNRSDEVRTPGSPVSPVPEIRTAGRLFVFGRSIYLTLHQFRERPEARAGDINGQDRETPRPRAVGIRTISFVPEMALRPDVYTPSFTIGEGFTTFVIDYNLLAKLPPPPVSRPSASQPAAAQSTSSRTPANAAEPAPPVKGDLQQIRDEMKQNATEVDELRKQLQELKHRLGEGSDSSSEAPVKNTPPTGSEKHRP